MISPVSHCVGSKCVLSGRSQVVRDPVHNELSLAVVINARVPQINYDTLPGKYNRAIFFLKSNI